jgi:hypothetical protein
MSELLSTLLAFTQRQRRAYQADVRECLGKISKSIARRGVNFFAVQTDVVLITEEIAK